MKYILVIFFTSPQVFPDPILLPTHPTLFLKKKKKQNTNTPTNPSKTNKIQPKMKKKKKNIKL